MVKHSVVFPSSIDDLLMMALLRRADMLRAARMEGSLTATLMAKGSTDTLPRPVARVVFAPQAGTSSLAAIEARVGSLAAKFDDSFSFGDAGSLARPVEFESRLRAYPPARDPGLFQLTFAGPDLPTFPDRGTLSLDDAGRRLLSRHEARLFKDSQKRLAPSQPGTRL